jgi:hypothetical protein
VVAVVNAVAQTPCGFWDDAGVGVEVEADEREEGGAKDRDTEIDWHAGRPWKGPSLRVVKEAGGSVLIGDFVGGRLREEEKEAM